MFVADPARLRCWLLRSSLMHHRVRSLRCSAAPSIRAGAAPNLSAGPEAAAVMLEREVKVGAGPAFHLPGVAGVMEGVAVGPSETIRLETIYFDTADLRLARWGVSLRHRAGEGWTLKLAPPPSTPGKPAAVLERDELTFEGGAKKPPEAALEVVRAYVRKAELVPVARLSTVRRRVRLVCPRGCRRPDAGGHAG